MIYRRNFFHSIMALGLWPFTRNSHATSSTAITPNTEDKQIWPKDSDPNYWRWIRKQFSVPLDEAYFNAGTLGARPRQVIDAVVNHFRENERTIAHYDYRPEHVEYIAGYRPQLELRKKVGTVINANEREVGLIQNATMGVSFIANGLDLKSGDEVLMTNWEHAGGRSGWKLRAKRTGINVRKLPIPVPPTDPETITKIFADAVTSRTRVIAVPHIIARYGIVMPVQQICELAKQHGIFTLIDGAQAVGQLRVDVRKIGCDAYSTSPHKWMYAPAGNGLLYIREERINDVWATLAGVQWDNHKPTDGIFRLMQFGTANLSLLVGLEAAIDFYLRIGPERVEKRIVELADRLRNGLQKIKGVKLYTPTHPSMVGGIVTYNVNGVKGLQVQDELWNKKKIRVRALNGEDDVIRQCVHIYNSPEEIDATLEIVKAIAKP